VSPAELGDDRHDDGNVDDRPHAHDDGPQRTRDHDGRNQRGFTV
jgi:hypothetical protein